MDGLEWKEEKEEFSSIDQGNCGLLTFILSMEIDLQLCKLHYDVHIEWMEGLWR